MSFQWLFDRPIAHRGLHDANYPENSIPAFEQAIAHGYNIEIDTHVTKDGRVVVFHDDALKRVCGDERKIKDCTLEELKRLRLAGSEYTIPTFEEFLACIDGKTGVLCEIKGINPFDNTIAKKTIECLKDYSGPIALQSFNFSAVQYARKHSSLPVGELCTWSSLDNKNDRWIPANFMGKMWVCKFSKPDFIAYNVRACQRTLPKNKYIEKWSKKLPILFWTINSDERIEDAQKYANNIIFEDLPLDKVEATIGTFRPFACPEDKLPANFSRKSKK